MSDKKEELQVVHILCRADNHCEGQESEVIKITTVGDAAMNVYGGKVVQYRCLSCKARFVIRI